LVKTSVDGCKLEPTQHRDQNGLTFPTSSAEEFGDTRRLPRSRGGRRPG